MSELQNKPEIKYCITCTTHTPHIMISKTLDGVESKKKFCLICCRKSNINEKDISDLDARCEYCSSVLDFMADYKRSGRRFCRFGRCATAQHKFMKTWSDKSNYAITKKISDLRRRLIKNQNYNSLDKAMQKKYKPLSEMKIGIMHNQIAMLFNIKETQKKLIAVTSTQS